nr:metalloregulator ArsR/SmtB family transcription factor [Treponema sp. Marseille-Q4130]
MNSCSFICYKTNRVWRSGVAKKKIEGGQSDKCFQDILNKLPDEDELFDLAELFKIFGDSTRIKILFVLLESNMAVNDIANVLKMTQSAISHQLRILKTNGLVKYTRNGKSLIYSLADGHVTTILSQGIEHISE